MSRTSTYTEGRAEETEAQTVARLSLAATQHETVPEVPFSIVVPEHAELKLIDPEALQDNPSRARGTARPSTVQGLLRYVGHHNEGTTELYVSTEQIVAVLNGRGEGGQDVPGWGDHRAVLDLQHSPEWKHWLSLDGQMVDQARFAEHIEEGLVDIVEPDSADMLEIVQHFHVSRAATFRSSQHLQSGAIGFVYDEADEARAGKGKDFEIPREFTLGIPVYEGEDAYRMVARFRYRLREGVLSMGYKLDRPDIVKRDAAEQIAERLRSESGLFAAVVDGAPAAPVSAGRLD